MYSEEMSRKRENKNIYSTNLIIQLFSNPNQRNGVLGFDVIHSYGLRLLQSM